MCCEQLQARARPGAETTEHRPVPDTMRKQAYSHPYTSRFIGIGALFQEGGPCRCSDNFPIALDTRRK